MEQVITDYTRIAITPTENQRRIVSKSLLDHFSTNRAKYIKRSGILELGMVDHFLIFAVRKVNAWRQRTGHRNVIEARNLRKYNKQRFLADLRQIDWISILDPLNNDPDKMASTFHEIFQSLLEIHAPLKKKMVRNYYVPWITSNIRKDIERRDKHKRLSSKNTSYWQDYKTLRNKVTNDIRLSVKQHYKDLISQNRNDPKKMWKTINKVLDKDSKSTSISQLKESDTTIENRQEILETLNKHFVTVGPNLARKIERKQNENPPQFLKRANPQENFKFSMVDQETMLQAIK